MADRYTANSRRTSSLLIIAGFLLFNLFYHVTYFSSGKERASVSIPIDAAVTLAKCRSLNLKPGPPADFYRRSVSDRLESGTKTVLIRNATVWTGRVQGLEVIHSDLLLEGGIIRHIGSIHESFVDELEDLAEIDAQGAWVTPGIIDVHSHLGVEAAPATRGTNDGNSAKGLILPWLRSLDAINTHDEGYASSISGGLTTALILPGSANAIGGQAFVIKLRPTKERSPTAMLLEPPFNLNSSYTNHGEPLRWRHMKHACGENPSGMYSGTRMDTFWAFRKAYDTARNIKAAQDEYCANALAGNWHSLQGESFPEELRWEALVDVLRGRVKVQTHCYEAVDLDDFVRLSNEFQFPVAAFHHAHEAWLVPDVLKRAYEHPPAVAMFAAFSRYKREAFRHSEFAPRVLADNDIDVVMKSDHHAIVSRYLIHEAAQAHYHGLDANIALASVTTTAAKVLGLDHRIGYIKPGYDADLVIWDSHPLSLGATPKQVFIDGIPQIKSPHNVQKPPSSQAAPKTPNFDKETREAVEHEGLPPLAPARVRSNTVLFTNVSNVWLRKDDEAGVYDALGPVRALSESVGTVVVTHGRVACAGLHPDCAYALTSDYEEVDLQGGALQVGLVSAGAPLGLQEIAMESSTTDGPMYNLLAGDPPSLAGGTGYLPHAADGLMFGTRDALLAYRSGVTVGVSAPLHESFSPGLSVAFSLGAAHKLEKGAMVQDVAALHIEISHGGAPSVSTAIAALRRLLLDPPHGDGGKWYKKVTEGSIPLVVETNNADIIATIILLKREVEAETGKTLRLTVLGGAEAHLLAHELAEAGVGVLLTPPRPLAYTWDHRRALPGLPLTNQSAVARLVEAGVMVGIGQQGTSGMVSLSSWAVRNLRFDAGWELLNAPDTLSKADVYALVSSNVETLLGLPSDPYESDLVATSGGDLLSYGGKVVAVISPRRGKVDFFE